MRYAALALFLYFASIAHCAWADSLHLVLPKKNTLEPEITGRYYIQALQLALHKTATPHEHIQITHYDREVARERARLLVQKGTIDVVWSSSSPEREAEFAPVKFNLLRGINEYRLLLIRADDQERFNSIKTLTDLQRFKIGTGTHWSDTEIYRFNGLPIVKSYSYAPMFRMLKLKRFDYMARSLQEVKDDVERYDKLGLAIEKNLMIHYSQPIYFFLNKKNVALAERIKRGLEIAQQDGSLDALFFDIPNFRQAWEMMQTLDRKTIELRRPQ